MGAVFKLMTIYLTIVSALFFFGCKPSGEAPETPSQISVGVSGSPQAPESTQGTGQAEPPVIVTIDSTSISFQADQPASFTGIVSGLKSIPRFEWLIDGLKIPDVTQTIAGFFTAGTHTIQINVFDDQNQLLGSATKIVNVTAAIQPAPSPTPEPTPSPTPTPTPSPTPTPEPAATGQLLICLQANVDTLKTSANNLLSQSYLSADDLATPLNTITSKLIAAINPSCLAPIVLAEGQTSNTISAEIKLRLLSTGGLSIDEITADGLALPFGQKIESPKSTLHIFTNWAWHFFMVLEVPGQLPIKKRLTQTAGQKTHYSLTSPGISGALQGSVIAIEAVRHELSSTFSILLRNSTLDVANQKTVNGGGGNQVESIRIFSKELVIP